MQCVHACIRQGTFIIFKYHACLSYPTMGDGAASCTYPYRCLNRQTGCSQTGTFIRPESLDVGYAHLGYLTHILSYTSYLILLPCLHNIYIYTNPCTSPYYLCIAYVIRHVNTPLPKTILILNHQPQINPHTPTAGRVSPLTMHLIITCTYTYLHTHPDPQAHNHGGRVKTYTHPTNFAWQRYSIYIVHRHDM